MASELVVVLVVAALSVLLLANRDQWSSVPRFSQTTDSSTPPSSVTHSDLQVVGTGTESPTDSGKALQGATSLQQSGERGDDLQPNIGEDKQLQPNTGESSLSGQNRTQ